MLRGGSVHLENNPALLGVGSLLLDCNSSEKSTPGRQLRAYLRPEDIVARPIAAGDTNVLEARIEKIEFLGSYCLVRVAADGLGQPLTVYLSLNFLSEQGLAWRSGRKTTPSGAGSTWRT